MGGDISHERLPHLLVLRVVLGGLQRRHWQHLVVGIPVVVAGLLVGLLTGLLLLVELLLEVVDLPGQEVVVVLVADLVVVVGRLAEVAGPTVLNGNR